MAKKPVDWEYKLNHSKPHQVKPLDKSFADMTTGEIMLIATPKIVDDYIRRIPKGKSIDVKSLRKDLAREYLAENTCPLTTGIFLRIAAEAAFQQYKNGVPISKITPVWRVIDEKSAILKKLTFDKQFILDQRKKEKLS